MTLEEFEQRTGIYPSEEMYRVIEQFYAKFDGDEDAFCKAYSENADGLALKVQEAATKERFKQEQEARETKKEYEDLIAKLKAEVEQEREWKPYVDTDNVSQADYEKLVKADGTRLLSEPEAKDLLYDWYGFAKEKLIIHLSIPKYEVDRHRNLREVGTIDRFPAYNATDWNYIRFDCGCMSYELYNDNLRLYVH